MVRTPRLARRLRRLVETLASPHAAAGFVFASLFAFPLANLSETAAEAGSTARVEVTSARTATSKTYRNPNGSYSTVLFADPVHFRDREGRWAAIDPTLVEQSHQGYDYATRANRFRARFKSTLEGEYARVEVGTVPYSLELEGARGVRAEVSGAHVRYRDALPSTNLEYETAATEVKETLVLKDGKAPDRFRFILRGRLGDHPVVQRLRDGSWRVRHADEEASTIVLRAPFATDRPDGSPMSAPHAQLSVRPHGRDVVLDLSVDRRWLRAPGRRFPVRVDPTIELATDTLDASFKTSCAGCPADLGLNHLIGVRGSDTWRAALKFDLGDIPPGANITTANLRLWHWGWCIPPNGSCAAPAGDGGIHRLDVHKLLAPWSHASTAGELKVEGDYVATYDLPATWDTRWMSWDLTKTVENWQHGRIPNYGVLVKRRTEPDNAGGPNPHTTRWHDSELHPRLEITYTTEGVELLEPPTLHSNGAQLKWTRYSPLSGGPFESYELHRSRDARFTPSRATLLTTIADIETTTFRDATAAPSKNFTYKVVANGVPSNERTVTLPPQGQARKFLQPGPLEGKATHLYYDTTYTDCAPRGTDAQLWVGPGNTINHRILVQFPLGDIPAGSSIQSATLQLYRQWGVWSSPPPLQAHRVTASWEEGTSTGSCNGSGATWYERQGGLNWLTPGGDFDSNPAATTTVANVQPGWDSFQIAGLVQQWVSATAPNHGVLVRRANDVPGTNAYWFYYADDFAPAPTLRPRLTVDYSDGSDAVEPTVSISEPLGGPVKGTISVTAAAGDDRRVETVEFFVDGKQIGADGSPPFTVSWDTTKWADGVYPLTAKAIDDAGNETTTAVPVEVTVGNSAPPETNVRVLPDVPYATAVLADTPVAYWRLGETTGPAALDSSPNGRHGTYGARVYPGQPGGLAGDTNTSAKFDGISWNGQEDDEVTIPDHPSLDFGTGNFTAEAWIKTNTTGGEETVLGKFTDASGQRWRITVTNDGGYEGRFRAYVKGGGGSLNYYGPDIRVDDDRWHHVVAVFIRNWGARVYVDGHLKATPGVVTGSVDNDTPLQIGGDSSNDPTFRGRIDEAAVYAGALSHERVLFHYRAGRAGAWNPYRQQVLASQPDSYLRLGEVPGTGYARDLSGNNLKALYEPHVDTGLPGALANDADTAAQFHNQDLESVEEELEIIDNPLLDFGTGDFTAEAWVKTGVNTDRSIMSKCCADSLGYWKVYVTDDPGYENRLAATIYDKRVYRTVYGPPISIADNAWHHVAVSFQRDWGIRLYVDGVGVAHQGPTTHDVSNSADFEIGNDDWAVAWHGFLDEVAVYPRVLPEARIQAHHDKGRSGTGYEAAILKDAPRGYWRLGEPLNWTRAWDESGNDREARYQAVEPGVDGIFTEGDSNTAARFGGWSGETFIDLEDRYDFAGVAPFSVEAWIKPTDVRGFRRIASKEDGQNNLRQGWNLYVKDSDSEPGKYWIGFERYPNAQYGDGIGTPAIYPTGVWKHLVATYDGSTMVVYMDGKQAAIGLNRTQPIPDNPRPFRWGEADWIDSEWFNGDLDEAAVYTRALSAEEVLEHYDAAKGPGKALVGIVKLGSDATDDEAVTKVEFLVDGVKIGEDALAPFEFDWNTLDAAKPAYDGLHDVATKAYDAHAQATMSTPLRVRVANTAGTPHSAEVSSTTVPDSVAGSATVEVAVKNTSEQTWNAGQMSVSYRWVDPVNPVIVAEGTPQALVAAVVPGESRNLTFQVSPPALPPGMSRGQYRLRFDLYDNTATKWFERAGNKPLERLVSVLRPLDGEALGLERYYQYEGEDLGAGVQHLTNVATGNSLLRWTPFQSPGRGLSTVLDLTYNSREGASDSPVGHGWSLGLSSLSRIGSRLEDESPTVKKLIDGDGTVHRFEKGVALDGTTYWKEPPGVHLYLREYSTTDPLRKWAVTRPDRVTFFYGTDNLPTFVEDPNGNRITFLYENALASEVPPGGSGKRLVEVQDAAGRSYALDYYTSSQWNELTNPSFETGLDGWTTVGTATRVPAPTRIGGHALRVNSNGTQAIASTSVGGTGQHSNHHASVYVRTSDSVRPVTFTLRWLLAVPVEAATTTVTASPNRWTKLSLVTGLPPGGNPAIELEVKASDLPGGESIYVDGAALGVGGEVKPYTDAGWPVASTPSMLGRVATITDHNGSRLDFRYSDGGRLTQLVQRGGQNADGSALLDRTIALAYDGAGRVERVTDPRTNPTVLGYDTPSGRLTSRTNRDSEPPTTFAYDTANRTTTVNEPLGRETTYAYDADGKPTRITLKRAAGEFETTKLIWSRDRHVTKVIEPTGVFVEYAYDDNGYLTDQLDELRNHTKLEYEHIPVDANDAAGKWADGRSHPHISQLIRKTDPKGMATKSPPDDYQWKFSYDERGNLLKTTDPLGYSEQTVYHENGTVSAEIDANGHKTTFAGYDGNGLPTAIVGPTGSTTRFGYDADGLLRWVQDPNHAKYPEGAITEPRRFRTYFDYDSFHRLGRQSAPKHTETEPTPLVCGSVVYDANDNLVHQLPPHPTDFPTSCNGGHEPHKATTTFDAMDRPIRTVVPHATLDQFKIADIAQASTGTTVTVAQNARWSDLRVGRLVDLAKASDGAPVANGNSRRITGVDQDARTVTLADGRGDVTVGTSDAIFVDDLASRNHAMVPRETVVTYDDAGRLQRATAPKGVTTTEADDYTTVYAYDLLDRVVTESRLTGVTSPGPRRSHYCYDLAGDLRWVTRPKAELESAPTGCTSGAPAPAFTAKVDYDVAHRTIRVTSPRGFEQSSEYDANGQVVSATDQERTKATQVYNERGEVVQRTVPFEQNGDKVTRSITTRLEYDPVGNLVREISPRAWDAAGTREEGFPFYVTSYVYDAADRLVREQLPDDRDTDQAWVHHKYDANGQVVWTSLPVETPNPGLLVDGQKTQMEYWDTGWIKEVVDPVRTWVKYDYTPRGQQATRDPSGQANTERWDYFADGSLRQDVDPGADITTFRYDLNGNLTRTDDASGVYSPLQKPRQVQQDFNLFDEPVETRQYEKSETGALSHIRTDRQDFDPHGNLKSRVDDVGRTDGQGNRIDRWHTFNYDADDRLVEQIDEAFGSEPCGRDQRVTYDYEDNGRLTRESIFKSTGATDCASASWPLRHKSEYSYFRNGDVRTEETYSHTSSGLALVESHALEYVKDTNGDGWRDTYMNGHRVEDRYKLVGPGGTGACAASTCTATYAYDSRDRLVVWDNGISGANHSRVEYELDDHENQPIETLAGDITWEKVTTGSTVTEREYEYSNGVADGQEPNSYRPAFGELRLMKEKNAQGEWPVKERFFHQRGNQRCITGADGSATRNPDTGVVTCSGSLIDTYTWDGLDRLSLFESSRTNKPRAERVEYTYDAFDRPVEMKEQRGGQQQPETKLEYMGTSDAVANDKRGSVSKTYSYDAGLGRLGMHVDGGPDPGTYGFGRNPHGDVSLLLTETAGAKAAYGYLPYGENDPGLFAGDTNDQNALNAFRFNDRRLDLGSGSIDMGARRFSPDTGRFLEQDFYRSALDDVELGYDPMTQNRYGFAGGNPVSFVETDGHQFGSLCDLSARCRRARGAVARGAKGMAKDAVMSAWDSVNVTNPGRMRDQWVANWNFSWTGTKCTVFHMVDSCLDFGKQLVAPTVHCYNRGGFWEAVGCAAFQIGSVALFKGRTAPARRLPQDINVKPKAPEVKWWPGRERIVSKSPVQQAVVRGYLQGVFAQARAQGVSFKDLDLRLDQEQVNAKGVHVGRNRPDLQYTINGVRYYVEFDWNDARGKRSSADHEQRIRANDPKGRFTPVLVKRPPRKRR